MLQQRPQVALLWFVSELSGTRLNLGDKLCDRVCNFCREILSLKLVVRALTKRRDGKRAQDQAPNHQAADMLEHLSQAWHLEIIEDSPIPMSFRLRMLRDGNDCDHALAWTVVPEDPPCRRYIVFYIRFPDFFSVKPLKGSELVGSEAWMLWTFFK